jgi:predicted  nucleic acid-binding Zn-ribbon protein
MAKVERESINFKLPKSLIKELRAKARELNTTATDLVTQGLHHVLGSSDSTDNNVETRLHQLEEELQHSAPRIEKCAESSTETQQQQRFSDLEQQIKVLANRLALIESALVQLQRNPSTQRGRKSSGYPYYQQASIELQPMPEENLAKRLAVDVANLSNQRQTLSPKEFLSWSRSRDPGSVGWRYQEQEAIYFPVK